jgi:hypothetical protein
MVDDDSREESAPSRKALNRAAPMGSVFDELFRSGRSAWLKIGGAALATPLIVFALLAKAQRRGQANLGNDPATLAMIAGGSALAGAFLGASLSLKDIVNHRIDRNEPVPFLLEIFFGMGAISLLAVWVPLAFVAAIAVAILTL